MRPLLTLLLLSCLLVGAGEATAQNKHSKAADDAFADQQYALALEKYQKAYSKVKRNREERDRISFQMAECYRMMNNTKRAEVAYKRLTGDRYRKKNPKILLYYADALKTNGKYGDAIEQYTAYKEVVPDDPAADAGIETATIALEWMENPSKYTVELQKKISTRDDDFAPAYADKNFNSIIFTSNRDAATGKQKDNWTGMKFTDLFFARKDRKGDWQNPVPVDPDGVVNTEANEGAGQFNSRFTGLYFTRCWNEPKKKNGCAIYKASRIGGTTWGDPAMVDMGIDSTVANGHPTISSDEGLIIFSSDRAGGMGGKDLWKIIKKEKGGGYTRPINLGPEINTPGDELFPFLRNDTVLYFASSGHPGMGGFDIFVSTESDGKWGPPENLKYPINTHADDFAIVFNLDEPEEGFFSSNRPGGRGKDDIYSFIIPPVYFTLEGYVTDDLTLQPIAGVNATIVGTDGKTATYNTDQRGRYVFNKNQILPVTTYEILVTKKDYFNEKVTETTVGLESSRDLTRDFVLRPIPKKPVVLPDILYDLAKWDLKPQFQDSLQELIATLDANETIVIELAAHTDSRDTEERNDILSQRRAQSVVDYMISRGIDPERLVAKGYGERVPRTLNREMIIEGYHFTHGNVLTDSLINSLPNTAVKEAAHQLNRRTEFAILRNDYIPKSRITKKPPPTIEIVVEPEENSVICTLTKEETLEAICYVNGITSTFQYDPRETEFYISSAEAIRLLTSGAIDRNDFVGDATQLIGEGFIANKAIFNIREMRIGKSVARDLKATVNQKLKNQIYFGPGTLRQFGAYSVDASENKIIFE
ncbi:MAG: OmpA family protein [Bacteroidota bacterium]